MRLTRELFFTSIRNIFFVALLVLFSIASSKVRKILSRICCSGQNVQVCFIFTKKYNTSSTSSFFEEKRIGLDFLIILPTTPASSKSSRKAAFVITSFCFACPLGKVSVPVCRRLVTRHILTPFFVFLYAMAPTFMLQIYHQYAKCTYKKRKYCIKINNLLILI